jgi:hypothetical protein
LGALTIWAFHLEEISLARGLWYGSSQLRCCETLVSTTLIPLVLLYTLPVFHATINLRDEHFRRHIYKNPSLHDPREVV